MSEITPLPTGGFVVLFDEWVPPTIDEITPLPSGGFVVLFEDPSTHGWSLSTLRFGGGAGWH